MHAKQEVEIMIIKGMTSYFAYPGPGFFGLNLLFFLFTNNGCKNLEKHF